MSDKKDKKGSSKADKGSSAVIKRAEDAADRVTQAGRNLAVKADEIVKAGVGVIESARSQAGDTFDHLVERGRKSGVEKKISEATDKTAHQAKSTPDSAVEKVAKPVKEVAERISDATRAAEKTVAEVVVDTLRRVNVPTSDDIKRLRKGIEKLNKSVDELAS